jgi:hypothetical protein
LTKGSTLTQSKHALPSVGQNWVREDAKGEVGMKWASRIALALVSFVAIFLAVSPSQTETVQFYCRHPIPTNDLVVAVDYSTKTVRWNLASNIQRKMAWLGPAKARITKSSIVWIKDNSMYQIDLGHGDPVCGDSGCWMSCQPTKHGLLSHSN